MLVAADVMTTDVISVSPETLVQDVAKLLYKHRINGLPVVDDEERVIGIVSEGDLIRHVEAIGEQRRSWWLALFSDETALARDYAKIHGRTARDVMTPKVIAVDEATPVAEIAMLLERHRIKRVPVLSEGKLIGIVTRSNLIQALATADVHETVDAGDSTIREQLIKELKAQPWARLAMVNVAVKAGIVHLFGLVRTDEERNAIQIAAKNISGVKGVEDHMKRWKPMNDL